MINEKWRNTPQVLETVLKVYRKTIAYELIRCKVNDDGTCTWYHSDRYIEENPKASRELNIELNMKELFETFNTYISSRSYFSKYVHMYMIEKYGEEGFIYINSWNLTNAWLIVEYYSEETDNDETLDLPIKDFLEYIKSKENGSNM